MSNATNYSALNEFMHDLLEAWRSGDQVAFEVLVKSHHDLMWSEIRRFGFLLGHCRDDLWSCALEGLYIALAKFDMSKGQSIVTYSVYWIRAKLMEYMRNEWSHGTMRKISKKQYRCKLVAQERGTYNVAELVRLGFSEKVASAVVARHKFEMQSIDEPNGRAKDDPDWFYAFDVEVPPVQTPEEHMIEIERDRAITQSIGGAKRKLTANQNMVVDHVLEHGFDLVSLADHRGVSRQAVDNSWRAACRNLETQLSKCPLVKAEIRSCQKKPKHSKAAIRLLTA
ncbi:sigma-70 family RNA polymerase sigma factor [Candidatus Dependentiae bacterium]|nr:MAG: sigma-70 family RNA polymerase sigma factor [Candidatus Dependentiae bacterium]